MTRSAADRIIVLNCPVFRETSPNAGTWKFFLFNVIMADQQFCLRWNNHQNTLISVFDTLLEGEILVDCTLAAEGKFLRAHKVVLSACSPFFSDLLRQHYEQHPILIMKDVKFEQLKAMLDYMYRGEVKISQDQLGTFLKAAESLQIKGLSDSTSNCESQPKQKTTGESNTLRTLSKADGDLTSSVSRSPTNRRKKRRHPSGSCDDVVSEENSNDRLCESNTPPPTKLSVESRMSKVPSPTVPQDNDSGAVNEATRNVPFQSLPVSTSVMYSKGGLPQQQPSSLIDTLVFEPKSEFIELDEDEDMNQDDSVAEAGPSHSQDDSGGYNWHVDRPEDSYLSQESPSGPRNAQDTWYPSLPTQQEVAPPLYGPYNCPRCARKYAVLYTLERHLRYECGVDKQFACPVCQRRFSRRDVLRTHQKNSKHYSESEESGKNFMDMIALSAGQRKA
ncbi:protein bric-a-brac 1-like isoform X6 [Thrips palmi]|uniref:Protein bric-a-brac 1-like isoform X6 n=1 Tax=Thrips palmi TaxID=161013 RepID=A0A6P8ZX13_THRPL|nr:protein bric-a-brac 1-like isoform X6 [Thrips palmi]